MDEELGARGEPINALKRGSPGEPSEGGPAVRTPSGSPVGAVRSSTGGSTAHFPTPPSTGRVAVADFAGLPNYRIEFRPPQASRWPLPPIGSRRECWPGVRGMWLGSHCAL